MRFAVLGPLRVTTADGRPVHVPETKVRTVLGQLLAHDGRPVSTTRLIDAVWDDRPPRRPTAALQVKVSQLRRALNEAEPGARELVVFGPAGYALDVTRADTDVRWFRELYEQATSCRGLDPKVRLGLLDEALALWRGPAFADLADAGPAVAGFAAQAAVRLAEERAQVLEERAQVRLDLGEHHALAPELADLVARYPLRERLRAIQLRALCLAGRGSEALAAFEALRRRLRDELGTEPGPELLALHQAMLRRDPSLEAPPAQFARVAPPRAPGAPLTELVGRAEAVAEVRELLRSTRLVTLTGPGGVGKSRLAHAVWEGPGEGERWLVDLSGVGARPGAVAEAVTAATGRRAEDPPDAGRRLLVLDGCEQLVDQAAELTERLLVADPRLRVLVTSQVPLRLHGEVLREVPPLTVPAAGETDLGAPPDAVRLFALRAAARAPGFTLTADNVADVGTICRRLDGIPLAIELAAARVRSLGVRRLAGLLDDRFRLLTTGARDAPARQRTLRAALEWSWEPLTPDERAVLRRLAVHPGGCTLQAAEATCSGTAGLEKETDGTIVATGAAQDGPAPERVLDLLAELVDRSLVSMVETGQGPRYRLLRSVAAYGVEQLRAEGEWESALERRDTYYLLLAECAETYRRLDDEAGWPGTLDDESSNFRATLHSALGRRSADIALRLVCALAWYWVRRGRLDEAREALGSAVALPGAAPAANRERARTWQSGVGRLALLDDDRTARGRLLADLGLGLVARRTGRLDQAESHLHAALAWPAGDIPGTVEALILAELGFLAELRGQADESYAWHRRSLTVAREARDGRAIGSALEGLAGARALAGDTAGAEALLSEATTARTAANAPPSPAERDDRARVKAALRPHRSDRATPAAHQAEAPHPDHHP
ncbi:BTAD domain-containing putative transcriptional regulator [Streptomyces profundus]|uniref:BTAD domain-containing putative transcriptional regulator n=1 Tax=Streptomyces profundus TaxID=2867410 RepID=UPI001D166036|nr:BTAD domain-containing putative transcriptional regulator [Streptomyces sp. MA3_2.13]UED84962.1 winged helix-turn-helix domain-containing protein [Streptomyces sp. MA3_2.13]